MPLIKEVGEFEVIIKGPRWEQLEPENGDPNRMRLTLPCYTTEEEPRHLDFYIYFTRTLHTKGTNRGRPTYEVAMEQCIGLGMSEPFDPKKISELDGKEAGLVTTEDEYKGQKRIKGLFLNRRRRPALAPEKAAEIWDSFGCEGTVKQDDDDLPDDLPF